MIEEKIIVQVPVTIVFGPQRKYRRALAVDMVVNALEESHLGGGGLGDGPMSAIIDGEIKVVPKMSAKRKSLAHELLHALKMVANDIRHHGEGYGRQSVVMKAIKRGEKELS